jgi:hypothetical protein
MRYKDKSDVEWRHLIRASLKKIHKDANDRDKSQEVLLKIHSLLKDEPHSWIDKLTGATMFCAAFCISREISKENLLNNLSELYDHYAKQKESGEWIP